MISKFRPSEWGIDERKERYNDKVVTGQSSPQSRTPGRSETKDKTINVGRSDAVCTEISAILAGRMARPVYSGGSTIFILHRQGGLQQDSLRLSGPPSGQGADGEVRIYDRRIAAESLINLPPTTPLAHENFNLLLLIDVLAFFS
ncbi:hypothetical protein PoB_006483900 [Plakobranchus ocellatus]|uniref:Uncharacterized protein n=1 Tax=Plakobranchus ocellatus TaxID=259542 RepID=A0AAV4D2A5_9GAST|nr:hypothetical protein PoB_006483900 [Plakobranchus ocellatus]